MSSLVSNFSTRVKECLNGNPMPLNKLSELTGIHKGSLSKYINGKLSPKIFIVQKVAQAFNVSPMWLAGYDVDKHIQPKGDIETAEELQSLITQLSPEQQAHMIALIKSILGIQ